LIQDGFGPHSVVIRRVWSIPCDTGVALFDAITGELAGVSACNIPPLVDWVRILPLITVCRRSILGWQSVACA